MKVPNHKCPCCGGSIKDAKLKISLEFNTIICGDKAIVVQPVQAELLFVLRKHFPKNVHKEILVPAVWGSKEVDDTAVRTMVYTARKVIEPLGWTIGHSSNRGYRLMELPT